MNNVPESLKEEFLLKTGDNVKVLQFRVRRPGEEGKHSLLYDYRTEVPYLHFRKSPIREGWYVVTSVSAHPKATDCGNPHSFCYTLTRVREDKRYSVSDRAGFKREKETYSERDLSTTKFVYNCLDFDVLIRDGKIQTNVYKPKENFILSEFMKDLGQLLYKHKVTLSARHTYSDPWDEDGDLSLAVLANGKVVASLPDRFPRRRSEPVWE